MALMLLNLLKSFMAKPSPTIIAQVLATVSGREEMLGMKKMLPPTEQQLLEDANKVVSFANKASYRVWATEAWSKVITHIDALQNPKATDHEIDYHRGALSATLTLLRVSELALLQKEELEKNMEVNVSTAR